MKIEKVNNYKFIIDFNLITVYVFHIISDLRTLFLLALLLLGTHPQWLPLLVFLREFCWKSVCRLAKCVVANICMSSEALSSSP